MNKREQLLADALGENRGEDFARLAAARLRRRRTVRQVGAIAAVAGVAAAAFLFRPQPVAPHIEMLTTGPAPAVEIISDQELLAQLKDQPVLILKDDNRITGVVFLDAGTKL